MIGRALRLSRWALGCAVLAALEVAAATVPGVIVESVKAGDVAARSGLQIGDVLLSWKLEAAPLAAPAPAAGELRDPFDLYQLRSELMPRGTIWFAGLRDTEPLSVVLPSGTWGFEVRPGFPRSTERLYREADEDVHSPRADGGLAGLRVLAERCERAGDHLRAAWLMSKAAEVLAEQHEQEQARVALREATRLAERAGRALPHAILLDRLARQLQDAGRFGEAARTHARDLEVRAALSQHSLAAADDLLDLAAVSWRRGEISEAGGFCRQALAIQQRLAPDSHAVARSLNNLGIMARNRGDFESAEVLYRYSLGILERLEPDSARVAQVLNNLGNLARNLGDFASAEDYHRRALAIRQRAEPGTIDLANSLHNLAGVAMSRGDLIAAEDLFRRALAIKERLAPDSLTVANTLDSLGTLLHERAELEAAGDFQRRALAIREKLTPESLHVAFSLSNLAVLARKRKDFDASARLLQRALVILERLAPDSQEVAVCLNNLANLNIERGDLVRAEELLRRARDIQSARAPDSMPLSMTLSNLGELTLARGDLDSAEDLFRHALTIRSRLAPGSQDEAHTLANLGRLFNRAGRRREALEHFARAVDALEAQQGRLGGSEEARSHFRAVYIKIYQDYISTLVDSGRSEDAFQVLERSRAQVLLAMLGERDLVFDLDLPPEIDRRRRVTDAAYDKVQARLAGLSPIGDLEAVDSLLAELRAMRRRQQAIKVEIRQLCPRLADLRNPEPLNLEGARRALEAGTVLLSYSVGQDGSHLFILDGGGQLRVEPLPVVEDDLRERVHHYRALIDRAQRVGADAELVRERAAELYHLLIAPAEPVLTSARRVLIVADGPLHTLPFASLRGAAGYLVESTPIHHTVSMTLLQQLSTLRVHGGARPSGPDLVAFGDPRYPTTQIHGEASAAGLWQGLSRHAGSLQPLPHTRREVEAIVGLVGQGTRAFLGGEASEDRVKALGRAPRLVHFACHAVLDERFPLDSGLVLSMPEGPGEARENGLLQAWEILEQVRLDADLVTLSACSSGLGQEVAGEGLIGLTRAFHYAGARSVLASLWNVADLSTAELMQRFYGHLKSGHSKDVALQKAQIELIRTPIQVEEGGQTTEYDFSHPYHWAGFQLQGDWR